MSGDSGSADDSRPRTDPSTTSTDDADSRRAPTESDDGRGRRGAREVEVPMRVYKTVTVFSTLIAVILVVGGFVLLDVATDRASAPLSEVDAPVALLGIAAIALGAVSYAFATRFRAPGMGKAKDDDAEASDNG